MTVLCAVAMCKGGNVKTTKPKTEKAKAAKTVKAKGENFQDVYKNKAAGKVGKSKFLKDHFVSVSGFRLRNEEKLKNVQIVCADSKTSEVEVVSKADAKDCILSLDTAKTELYKLKALKSILCERDEKVVSASLKTFSENLDEMKTELRKVLPKNYACKVCNGLVALKESKRRVTCKEAKEKTDEILIKMRCCLDVQLISENLEKTKGKSFVMFVKYVGRRKVAFKTKVFKVTTSKKGISEIVKESNVAEDEDSSSESEEDSSEATDKKKGKKDKKKDESSDEESSEEESSDDSDSDSDDEEEKKKGKKKGKKKEESSNDSDSDDEEEEKKGEKKDKKKSKKKEESSDDSDSDDEEKEKKGKKKSKKKGSDSSEADD